jgi:hypothetical protein
MIELDSGVVQESDDVQDAKYSKSEMGGVLSAPPLDLS